MKILSKIFLVAVLAVTGFLASPTSQADAASSNGYDYTSGSCRVKLWTDYYTYYPSSSTTVDTYATNSGCGTLYYSMQVNDQWGHKISSQVFTGYFSSQTPTKYFSISMIEDYEYMGYDQDAYTVEMTLYSNSARTNYVGRASTNIVVVK